MNRYIKHITEPVPQTEQQSPNQQKNNAGGYSFVIDEWSRLDRFLILGAEGGTYYVSEKKLTKDNAKCVLECLKKDGIRTVNRIVEISDSGRAPKNDPAVFCLALAAADVNPDTRKVALLALPKVCRISTDLFAFVESVKQLRGWGRQLKTAIASWYLQKNEDQLAYQILKYQQRNGFSHRDVLRLCHITGHNNQIFRWIVDKNKDGDICGTREVIRKSSNSLKTSSIYPMIKGSLPKLLSGYEHVKKANNAKEIVNLIHEYGFTHEMIPTEHKNSVDVWNALLEKMPLKAMLRNLGKMTNAGTLSALNSNVSHVCDNLTNHEMLKKARLHPLSILVALKTYEQGHGDKGNLTWNPVNRVIQALNEAFYKSFDLIEPCNKNMLLALDVSGSMSMGNIAGMPITPRVASAAMSMVTARTEKNWHVLGFSDSLRELKIHPNMDLNQIIKVISCLPFERTDCALPMLWALRNKAEVDAFVVYTDNETYFGDIHPHVALEKYRQKMGRNAKLIVVGMTSTEFSIANPEDTGMLDVVGFDTASPALISDFVRN